MTNTYRILFLGAFCQNDHSTAMKSETCSFDRGIALSFRACPIEFAILWPGTISTFSWIPDQVRDDIMQSAVEY